ncbi:MAG: hypothetical protein ACRDA4_00345 [Filifactoraceae bacterium]
MRKLNALIKIALMSLTVILMATSTVFAEKTNVPILGKADSITSEIQYYNRENDGSKEANKLESIFYPTFIDMGFKRYKSDLDNRIYLSDDETQIIEKPNDIEGYEFLGYKYEKKERVLLKIEFIDVETGKSITIPQNDIVPMLSYNESYESPIEPDIAEEDFGSYTFYRVLDDSLVGQKYVFNPTEKASEFTIKYDANDFGEAFEIKNSPYDMVTFNVYYEGRVRYFYDLINPESGEFYSEKSYQNFDFVEEDAKWEIIVSKNNDENIIKIPMKLKKLNVPF